MSNSSAPSKMTRKGLNQTKPSSRHERDYSAKTTAVPRKHVKEPTGQSSHPVRDYSAKTTAAAASRKQLMKIPGDQGEG